MRVDITKPFRHKGHPKEHARYVANIGGRYPHVVAYNESISGSGYLDADVYDDAMLDEHFENVVDPRAEKRWLWWPPRRTHLEPIFCKSHAAALEKIGKWGGHYQEITIEENLP